MFQKIFENGNKVFSKNLVLRFLESPDEEYRVAFIIRKKVGNAVVRNRIRRIIRETVFKYSQSFPKNYWILFNVNETTKKLSNNEIRKAIHTSLQKSKIIES